MFIEERLLDCIQYGSDFGSLFNTRITELANGREKRNIEWAHPLGEHRLIISRLRSDADHQTVIDAFNVCRGRAYGFRMRDYTDYTADKEPIGTATGTEQVIQLTKRYTFGGYTYDYPIKKPVAGTVQVFANGVAISGIAVDTTKGLVTLTATSGAALTWSGEFDKPVRFASDELTREPEARSEAGGYLLAADVTLQEIRV